MDHNLPTLGPALPPKSPRMNTNLPPRNRQPHPKEDKQHHTTRDLHHPAHHHPDDMKHDRSHIPQHHNGKDEESGIRHRDPEDIGMEVGYPPHIGDTRVERGVPRVDQSHDQQDQHRHRQYRDRGEDEGLRPPMPVVTASHPHPHPHQHSLHPVDLHHPPHSFSPNSSNTANHQHQNPAVLHIHPPVLTEGGKGPSSAPPLQTRHLNTPPASISSNQPDQRQNQKEGKGKEGGGGMLDRLKNSLLTGGRGPMSKTWARKSYVEELESIGPSSPTRTTGFRSMPVSPHTQNHERGSGRDLESQSQSQRRELRDLPRAKSVYASPAALAQFRALPPANAQGEIMSPPAGDAGLRPIGRV